MTREMYETLAMTDLRAIARQRGLKLAAHVKKAEIIDQMIDLDNREAAAAAAAAEEAKAARREAAKSRKEAAGKAEGRKTKNEGTEKAEEKKGRKEAKEAKERKESKEQKETKDQGDTSRGKGRRTVKNAAPAEAEAAPAQTPAEKPAKNRDAEAGPIKRIARVITQDVIEQRAKQAQAEQAQEETAPPKESREKKETKSLYAADDAQALAAREEARIAEPAAVYERPVAAQVSAEVASRYQRRGMQRPDQPIAHKNDFNKELDSGEMAHGILEVMGDGYGFIRSANYMPGDNDVYVAPSQIRRFNLKTGDIVEGNIRIRTQGEKFSALLFVKSINGMDPEAAKRRYNFEDMTPVFPDKKLRLEKPGAGVAMRVMDLMCPVGKGQRGMIVSPPKAGKTTLMKEVAKSVKFNHPEVHLIILLIDERPEEVTDIREAIEGPNVEVIYSTFDETPDHHKRVSEMVIERAKRLVEQRMDVMILLDSITRLTRAYNLTEPSSGRTLSGGLDPAALHMPKRFFGAARNMREGGSLTILATALIETGSKMDDVVYEEFKGTGNMEMILNRKLSERRIFPAIDLAKSGTRRDDLLLTPDEQEAVGILRRAFIGAKGEEATNNVLDLFSKTRSNVEFVYMTKKLQWTY